MVPLATIVEKFKEYFKEKPSLIASAPGRADFLNTHQDYKGLPVVPVAINLRAYMAFSPRSDDSAVIVSWNLKELGEEYRDSFKLKLSEIDLFEERWFGNYFRAVAKLFLPQVKKVRGFNLLVFSEVPVAAGLASSAAIEVAFAKGLSKMWNIVLPTAELAELCYIAEHDVLKIPCGRLDQYGSAFGGVIVLYPRPPVRVEKIPASDLVFTVVDSGIKHSTAQIHPKRQAEIDEGLKEILNLDLPEELRRKIGTNYWNTKWDEISFQEIEPYISEINEVSRKRIIFTIKMHESTLKALDLLKKENVVKEEKFRALGKIMNTQHELLRDLYDVSLPELELMRESMLKAGAYGVKISGAGLGGALIALVPDEKVGKKVLKAGIEAEAKRGWVARVDEGCRVDLLC
ncbi:MAG: GHMP kinase [Thermoprotei archaeon]|nr:MAG: GHMP kinase [Thermoprotei archaeon]RLF00147.1 MAG: GHMP kinase [Thermoprotei archaeon]HDI74989.1 GHMP kinase [Thermoprotei archaeon]